MSCAVSSIELLWSITNNMLQRNFGFKIKQILLFLFCDDFELINQVLLYDIIIRHNVSNPFKYTFWISFKYTFRNDLSLLIILLLFKFLEILCNIGKCKNQYKQQFCNIDEVCKIPLMINDMFMAHHHFLEKTAYGWKILISVLLFWTLQMVCNCLFKYIKLWLIQIHPRKHAFVIDLLNSTYFGIFTWRNKDM